MSAGEAPAQRLVSGFCTSHAVWSTGLGAQHSGSAGVHLHVLAGAAHDVELGVEAGPGRRVVLMPGDGSQVVDEVAPRFREDRAGDGLDMAIDRGTRELIARFPNSE